MRIEFTKDRIDKMKEYELYMLDGSDSRLYYMRIKDSVYNVFPVSGEEAIDLMNMQ